MGKSKDKKKVSGAVKTAAKTEKKLEAKRKKEIANIGEEDIESIVASIEREEAKRLAVVETVIAPPSARVSATFVPHPTNTSELILFGGEYHDGKKTYVYNGLYVYNTMKGEWRVIKAPGAPPPRSAHQAVALPSNKGELWVFGGEFTSPSEMQFYHYKDLWVFSLADRKWEKVDRPGAPSPRSGHRMCALRRSLIVFGGYHDNGRVYKYLGDLHVFCTDTRLWTRVQASGMGPCARSACLLMPVAPDSLLVYGGYSRVREGKTDHGVTHGDLFRLAPVPPKAGGDASAALQFRWEALKGGPARPQPARSSFSTCLAPGNKAYVFGGVQDTEETEEMLLGELFDSLHCLELDTGLWRSVAMRPQKAPKAQQDEPTNATDDDKMETEVSNPVTVCSDGIFTMTVAATPSKPQQVGGTSSAGRDPSDQSGPSPRMNAMMAVQKSTLYLYGGLVEKGDKQFTLSDMYSLDLHKLEGWKTIITQTGLPEWFGSESESDGEDSGSEGSDSESESD